MDARRRDAEYQAPTLQRLGSLRERTQEDAPWPPLPGTPEWIRACEQLPEVS